VTALVEVRDLAKTFDVSAPWLNRVVERKARQFVHAVDGVSFTIERGKTLALVGESAAARAPWPACWWACTSRRAATCASTARPPTLPATPANCARCAGACR